MGTFEEQVANLGPSKAFSGPGTDQWPPTPTPYPLAPTPEPPTPTPEPPTPTPEPPTPTPELPTPTSPPVVPTPAPSAGGCGRGNSADLAVIGMLAGLAWCAGRRRQFLIVARPPRPHSKLAARAILALPLLLALAAAALALGCARDSAGDAAPTVSAPPTQTPLPTQAPQPTGGHSRPSDLRCEEFGRGIEFNWQPGRFAQWSPDGSRIPFDVSVGEYGHPAVGLYGFDIGSYRLQQVVDPLESTSVDSVSGESVGLEMHFDVSPDGSRVVYSTCGYSDDRDYEIAVSAIDGTETQRLTENESFDNYAAWSPDGDLIAFISDRPVDRPDPFDTFAVNSLYIMAADGSEVRLVAPLSGDSSLRLGPHPPKWSPDGRSIAFVATEGPVVSAVYTVGTDGSGLTRIAEVASEPSWSPDGRRIALVVPDGYDEADLYTFAIDGSDPVRVVGVSAGFRPRGQHSQRQSSIARSSMDRRPVLVSGRRHDSPGSSRRQGVSRGLAHRLLSSNSL